MLQRPWMPCAGPGIRSNPSQTIVSLTFARATARDAEAVAALRTAVSKDLTSRYGPGHWSSTVTARGMRHHLTYSVILLARQPSALVGVLRLSTRKPWAIDRAYFRDVPQAIYLTDMAVKPALQRHGVGRRLLAEAIRLAREWPAQVIRVDAYDTEVGAGPFYQNCGFQEVGRVIYRGTPLIYFELIL
jgi:GNAT superfamily N-acetyltransferase